VRKAPCETLPGKSFSNDIKSLICKNTGLQSVLGDLHISKDEVHCQENLSHHFRCQSTPKKTLLQRDHLFNQPLQNVLTLAGCERCLKGLPARKAGEHH